MGAELGVSWTWAIIHGGSEWAVKPPPLRIIFAALEAAATTDASSTHIGTSTSWPLIWKLVAIASGRSRVPTTFSIMSLARWTSRPPTSRLATRAAGSPVDSGDRAASLRDG